MGSGYEFCDSADYPAGTDIPVRLLHRLFEQSTKENPDKVALVAKDKTMTYRQLDESANIVANRLIEKGVGTGDSVVLLLPRESSFFSCMFGVNKAGAAFIPCDPQYPADRIRSIIEDSGAACIITTADKLEDHAFYNAIDVSSVITGENTSDPDINVSGDDLAYMIYTSGSTGKPKGVMLRHIGICNYLMPHPANTHIHYLKHHIETYLSVTTVYFDMSFKEHTAALCNGKTLVFASEEEIARFDKSGNVLLLCRLDSQVKLRGLRIELSEIEELIAARPHIKRRRSSFASWGDRIIYALTLPPIRKLTWIL